jgi:hypothetical protein
MYWTQVGEPFLQVDDDIGVGRIVDHVLQLIAIVLEVIELRSVAVRLYVDIAVRTNSGVEVAVGIALDQDLFAPGVRSL